ncbi:hypothetical protein HPB50_013767 [Hyalomma asiaticum]|uniref:Uncharacterized protein n=1 Tax=Hyalomma asiaticum TaxID=266040 RepID=A0ACB7SLR6_HYAAI|nr:hypothetical protein HPB50_013767 [Hyalomma asiaticum]
MSHAGAPHSRYKSTSVPNSTVSLYTTTNARTTRYATTRHRIQRTPTRNAEHGKHFDGGLKIALPANLRQRKQTPPTAASTKTNGVVGTAPRTTRALGRSRGGTSFRRRLLHNPAAEKTQLRQAAARRLPGRKQLTAAHCSERRFHKAQNRNLGTLGKRQCRCQQRTSTRQVQRGVVDDDTRNSPRCLRVEVVPTRREELGLLIHAVATAMTLRSSTRNSAAG